MDSQNKGKLIFAEVEGLLSLFLAHDSAGVFVCFEYLQRLYKHERSSYNDAGEI